MRSIAGDGARLGVLLMTYGSPASLEDVPRYMTAVRGGRVPDEGLLAEFRRRYSVIGGSPLIPITIAQAAALEERLGDGVRVRAAMRFSSPTIAEQIDVLAREGVSDIVAIVMSPQFSQLLMGGYSRAIEAALAEMGTGSPSVRLAGAWHTERRFIEALARRVRDGLARLGDQHGRLPVLMTAHSLPRRVADQEPDYLRQLEETARLVADAAGLAAEGWIFCWQSAGHEPGEWMKPDFADLMPLLASKGHEAVLVVPVQFLADHLEILYDIDVGAREQAKAAGMRFARAESLNTDETFIEALANVTRRSAGVALKVG